MKYSPASRDFTLLAGSIALALTALPVLGQATPGPEAAPAPEVKADTTTPDATGASPTMTPAREAAAKVDAAAEAALLAIRNENRGTLGEILQPLPVTRRKLGDSGGSPPDFERARRIMAKRMEIKESRDGLRNVTTVALGDLKEAEQKFRATNPPGAALRRYLAHAALVKFRAHADEVRSQAFEDECDYTIGQPRPSLKEVSPMLAESDRLVDSVTLDEIRVGKYIPPVVREWPRKRQQILSERKWAANGAQKDKERALKKEIAEAMRKAAEEKARQGR